MWSPGCSPQQRVGRVAMEAAGQVAAVSHKAPRLQLWEMKPVRVSQTTLMLSPESLPIQMLTRKQKPAVFVCILNRCSGCKYGGECHLFSFCCIQGKGEDYMLREKTVIHMQSAANSVRSFLWASWSLSCQLNICILGVKGKQLASFNTETLHECANQHAVLYSCPISIFPCSVSWPWCEPLFQKSRIHFFSLCSFKWNRLEASVTVEPLKVLSCFAVFVLHSSIFTVG